MEEQEPLAPLLNEINNAITAWQKENTPEKIRKKVTERLNKQVDDALMKILGFNSSYQGGYTLDHCNGRSGQSLVGKQLDEILKVAVIDWISCATLPVLSKATMTALKKDAAQIYEREMRSNLREIAARKASSDAEKVVASLLPDNATDKYLKALKLIAQ